MTVPYHSSQAPRVAGNENRNLRILQSFGCLIAFTSDWRVACVSENCEKILGVPHNELIAGGVEDVFPLNVVHQIRTRSQVLANSDTATRVFATDLFEDSQLFDISIHTVRNLYVMEIERRPKHAQMRDDVNLVRRLTRQLRSQNTVEGLMQSAADAIKILTGAHLGGIYRKTSGANTDIRAIAPQDGGFLKPVVSDGTLQDIATTLSRSGANFTRAVADWNEAGSQLIPAGVLTDFSQSILAKMPRPYTLSVSLSAAVVSQISVNGEVWGGLFGLSTSSRYLDASACAAIDLYIDFLGTEIARVEELAEWQPTQAPAAESARSASLDLDHVLVVEDDAIIALDLAKSLVRFGVGVVEIANSEKDALDYLDVETPDFVLLDFHLGAENALEVARVLSERGIPFALATGSARDDLSVSDIGNPPVLEKPVDPDELQIVLGKANAA